MTHTLMVLVPRKGTAASRQIDPGSAVVADRHARISPMFAGCLEVEVYFEGNRFRNLATFDDALKHAAGRLLQRYPTTARGLYPHEHFDVVGRYEVDDDTWAARLTVTDEGRLATWSAAADGAAGRTIRRRGKA